MPVNGSQSTGALTASKTYVLTCTGSGGSSSQSATVTVSASPPTVSLSASPTSVASGGSSTLTWSATNATACTASGAWTGPVATRGSTGTGTLTTTKTYALNCTGTSGTATQSATVSVTGAPTGGTVSRPSYNTGSGFFVLNGKLYDPNGNEFRIRGVDILHWGDSSQAGVGRSGANTARIFMWYESSGAPAYMSLAQSYAAQKVVPILTMPLFPNGTGSSGNTSATELMAGVGWWVANAATFTAIDKYLMINIANEWGPSNSPVWRDAYVNAIASMRAAGYLGPLVIDAGGWGQNIDDLLNYSTAVFNSDPQKNVIFSLHIYGAIPTVNVAPDLTQLAALSASAGMVFIVGEFGPGRNIGPTPTLTTPGQVITAAEASGIGWIGWAWDDNNLPGGAANDSSFSMTKTGPGIYTQPSDLTTFGQDVVLSPIYGLQALAKRATIF
jgi:mannan endo-1,4-beta-mannosidase